MDKVIFLHYLLPFAGALASAVILTVLIKAGAQKLGIIDLPGEPRKIHTRPIPLLGGLAVFLTVLVSIFIFKDYILDGRIQPKFLTAIIVGGLFLMIVRRPDLGRKGKKGMSRIRPADSPGYRGGL